MEAGVCDRLQFQRHTSKSAPQVVVKHTTQKVRFTNETISKFLRNDVIFLHFSNNRERRICSRYALVKAVPYRLHRCIIGADLVVEPEDVISPVMEILRQIIGNVRERLLHIEVSVITLIIKRVVNRIDKGNSIFRLLEERIFRSIYRVSLCKKVIRATQGHQQ